ncbi:MAG: hypothetical protein ACI4RJ_02045 [Alphaproteobacteria bacterium]
MFWQLSGCCLWSVSVLINSLPAGHFVASLTNIYQCVKCPLQVAGTYPVSTKEQCHTCGNNYFLGASNFCNICTAASDSAHNASQDECQRCTNRYYDEAMQKCALCLAGKKASALQPMV